MRVKLVLVDDQLPELIEMAGIAEHAGFDIAAMTLFLIADTDEVSLDQIDSVRSTSCSGARRRLICGRIGAGGMAPSNNDRDGDHRTYAADFQGLIGDLAAECAGSEGFDRVVVVVDLRLESFLREVFDRASTGETTGPERTDGMLGRRVVLELLREVGELVDGGRVRVALMSRAPHLDRRLADVDGRIAVIPKSPERAFAMRLGDLLGGYGTIESRAHVESEEREGRVPVTVFGVKFSVRSRVGVAVLMMLVCVAVAMAIAQRLLAR